MVLRRGSMIQENVVDYRLQHYSSSIAWTAHEMYERLNETSRLLGILKRIAFPGIRLCRQTTSQNILIAVIYGFSWLAIYPNE